VALKRGAKTGGAGGVWEARTRHPLRRRNDEAAPGLEGWSGQQPKTPVVGLDALM